MSEDIDVLNAGLYRAIRDGYVEVAHPRCECHGPLSVGPAYRLTEKGLARARVLALSQGLDWEDCADPTAVAIELVCFGSVR